MRTGKEADLPDHWGLIESELRRGKVMRCGEGGIGWVSKVFWGWVEGMADLPVIVS